MWASICGRRPVHPRPRTGSAVRVEDMRDALLGQRFTGSPPVDLKAVAVAEPQNRPALKRQRVAVARLTALHMVGS